MRTWLKPVLEYESIDFLPHVFDLVPVPIRTPLPRLHWPAKHVCHGRHAAVRKDGLLQIASTVGSVRVA